MKQPNTTSFVVLFVFTLLMIRCHSESNSRQFELNGSWTPIYQEMGGNELPKNSLQDQKLVLKDSSYTFNAESKDLGIIQYKDGQMDIYGKEGVNKGKHFKAIYKIETETLTICYDLSGKQYPNDFSTTAKNSFFLSNFKRLN